MRRLDCEERTKDVHMLKVTRDTQAALQISGQGEMDRIKAREVEQLERKLDFMNSQTATKVETMRAKYKKLLQAAKKKRGENDSESISLKALQVEVGQREQLKTLQQDGGGSGGSGNGGGGGDAGGERDRFFESKRRKQFQDKITTQGEELQLLRTELDRLREKTFPSFVQVHDERKAIADGL